MESGGGRERGRGVDCKTGWPANASPKVERQEEEDLYITEQLRCDVETNSQFLCVLMIPVIKKNAIMLTIMLEQKTEDLLKTSKFILN